MSELHCWVLKPGCVLAHYFVEHSKAVCGIESHRDVEDMREAALATLQNGNLQQQCPKCAAKLRAEARREGRAS